jgi:hypothetical protein
MPDAQAAAPLRLTALSLADAAKVLSKAGRRSVSEDMLRADIEAGAHVNCGTGSPFGPDGTIENQVAQGPPGLMR